jgi:plasmid maintenance system antidote protein VapI
MTELERLNKVIKFIFLKMGIYKKADMAEFLGYKSPYFSGIINGKEKITEQFLKNISYKLGANIDYILTGQGEMTMKSQIIENASGFGIVGNNVNGGGINDSAIIDGLLMAIKKRDEQVDKLLSIIEKLSNK